VEAKVIDMAEDVVRAGVRDPEKVATYIRENHSMLTRGTVGGNTTCVSVEWPGGTVAFDGGTGLRNLGRKLMEGPFGRGGQTLTLLVSHTHWDHLMGFPFFPVLFQKNKINIVGGHDQLEERFRGQQQPWYFPVSFDIFPATITFEQIEEGRWYDLPNGGRFKAKRLNHPGDCYGYRVEHNGQSVVMATDSEYKRNNEQENQEVIEFFRDADLVIFDSQYTLEESMIKEDWGHSTAVIGVDMAVHAGVKRLALFHHEPTYSDTFIQELMEKARKYKNLNYIDADIEIFVAQEDMMIAL
jgi:phosphoribosyl 1,2-cyclic phosphodiesterase